MIAADAYEVAVDEPPPDAGVDLFQTRRYHALHGGCAFALRERATGVVVAVARFCEEEPRSFWSPGRGSYGGWQLVAGRDAPLAALDAFVAAVEETLRARGAARVGVVLPPLAYDAPQTARWINVLLRAGWSIARHELSYARAVAGPFLAAVDRGNQKQLKKCARAGLRAGPLAPAERAAAYDVLVENRRKKGNRLSMSFAALEELSAAFPEAVRWSGARADGPLLAAAVALRVNPRVLYVFYWGEAPGAEAASPTTLLADELYAHCLAEGVALLDVGTATLHGVPNEGLIRYKRNLGCTESLKLSLAKELR